MLVEVVVIGHNNEVIRKGSKVRVRYKSTGRDIEGTLISVQNQYLVLEVKFNSTNYQKMISTSAIETVELCRR